ncbi:MAG: hypothetical protein EBY21_00690 [Alphaproteobacteria bacterium]|nr:hypothetical protein [Alphaproteobacteria bacterium]
MELKAIWSELRQHLAALFGAALCLSGLIEPGHSASNVTQPDQASLTSQEAFLSNVTKKLSRRLQTGEGAPIVVASSPKALDLISSSTPAFMMLAQRDIVFARSQSIAGEKIEVYGRIPACVLVLGRPGWSPGIDSARSIDVGAEQSWTAETIKLLSTIEPLLVSSRIEHRGGARALDRVRNGEDDMAFVIVYDDNLDPITKSFLKDGSLAPIALFGPSHLREVSKLGLQYQSGQINVPVAQSWWRQTRFETLCTTLGIAVTTSADARLVETALASLTSGPIDEATEKIEKIWETVRQDYGPEIDKLRNILSDMAGVNDLKAIGAKLGVGAPEQKPGLVRPNNEDVSPGQPSKGPSLNR